jgi:3'-phosphoadenosine 5'-phosphosulfate sulfotransferase (PAPS reductase)/FAD synthetase
MDRWLQRWSNNVARYADLECVKLILPWSTPATRFCTSEMKGAQLAREMRRRYPTGDVVSVVGIRREESSARAKMPVWRADPRTTRRTGVGHTWHPVLHWSRPEVLDYIRHRGDTVHEAYILYLSSRVSCAFCIMSSLGDLVASASCADNQAIYREMVELEIVSTFSFQGQRWLGDVAPDLLDTSTRQRLKEAKERAAAREGAESMLPPELLFVSGWPTFVPSLNQAGLIAEVRRRVAQAVGLSVSHTDAVSVQERYAQLIDAANRKAADRRDLVVEGA